jgi:hypothetical protein
VVVGGEEKWQCIICQDVWDIMQEALDCSCSGLQSVGSLVAALGSCEC